LEISFEDKKDCIYYGSFRKGRVKYFNKYLDGNTVSTHIKNVEKFKTAGLETNFIPRIDWKKDGLASYKHSLYIEDEITHENYNYLANRFYEALNYNVIPIFGEECRNTIEKSGYEVGESLMVSSAEAVRETAAHFDGGRTWLEQARRRAGEEKKEALEQIKRIVLTN
jgi:hypothetical protein